MHAPAGRLRRYHLRACARCKQQSHGRDCDQSRLHDCSRKIVSSRRHLFDLFARADGSGRARAPVGRSAGQVDRMAHQRSVSGTKARSPAERQAETRKLGSGAAELNRRHLTLRGCELQVAFNKGRRDFRNKLAQMAPLGQAVTDLCLDGTGRSRCVELRASACMAAF